LTQTQLPGPDAAALGLAAFLVVNAQSLWSLAKHFHVMPHEGMHATTATILGIPVRGIILKRNGDGETHYRVPAVGGAGFVTAFVGYLGSSAFGLAAAGLISLGYIIAVLWLAVAFLVILLLKLIRSFGHITVPVTIALFFVLIIYTSARIQVVMAYCVTWVLLLSGVRMAVQHGAKAGDAKTLTQQTHLPRSLWALLWIAGTLGAAYVGWRLLVLRALCGVMEYFQVRHTPTLVAHIAGHDTQALGFDLALAGREEYVSPDERVPLPVKVGREYEPIAMRIRLDQEHRAAHAVQGNHVTLGAKVIHMQPAVTAPGVEIEGLHRLVTQLDQAMRVNDIPPGGQQSLHDVGRVVHDIRIYPQHPVLIDQGPGQQVVAAPRENGAPLHLPLRAPPWHARRDLEPEIPLPYAYPPVAARQCGCLLNEKFVRVIS
jgi:peptidase M50B-like protein